MPWKKAYSNEIRSWILFFSGLGLAYGLYRKGTDPGPYWSIIIGVFVGAGVLVSSILNTVSAIMKGSKDARTQASLEHSDEAGVGPSKYGPGLRIRIGRLLPGSAAAGHNKQRPVQPGVPHGRLGRDNV